MSDQMIRAVRRVAIVTLACLAVGLASAQDTCERLRVMSWDHVVPGFQQELEALLQEFAAERGVDVALEAVSTVASPSRLALAVQERNGLDVVALETYQTAQYADHLLPVDDLVASLEDAYGPVVDVGAEASRMEGAWRSVPWFAAPAPANVRTDRFEAAGIAAPSTWAELSTAAERLAGAGHPVALPVATTPESNYWLFGLLAGFGAEVLDEDGNPAIDSPETREALAYAAELATFMPPEALAWDAAGNDRFMISGEGSWTMNAASLYLEARERAPQVAESLSYDLPPAGPAGRFASAPVFTLGVTQWTECEEQAKDLVAHLLREESLRRQVEASRGYNQPLFSDVPEFEEWQSDPMLAQPRELLEFLHLPLWPAPPELGIALQDVFDTYLIPSMFARVVEGEDPADAIAWAEERLRRILGR